MKHSIVVFGAYILGILLLTGVAMVVKTKISNSNSKPKMKWKAAESNYTPEQKEVLKALRDTQEQIEKTKAEIVLLLNQAKATVIARNLDPNVNTTWIAYGPNGQYAVRSGTPEVPVMFGFRGDHLVVWKYADDKP